MIQQQINVRLNRSNYVGKTYDFMRWYYFIFSISTILVVASIVVLAINGFNWGLDFTGGTAIELSLEKPINLDHIRDAIIHTGINDPVVINFGNNRDLIIRIKHTQVNFDQKISDVITNVINKSIDQKVTIKRIEFVGPSIGIDLAQDTILALTTALVSILIYVSVRFDWRLAIGSILALLHDIMITLGILSMFHIEINLTIIASLMYIIGYSINDSIVVFDRIRENFRKINQDNTYDILNISLTQTLNRTIMTSVTTLILILMLIIFGGEMLHGSSITLFIGVLIGTISSIYVAVALAFKLGIKREHFF